VALSVPYRATVQPSFVTEGDLRLPEPQGNDQPWPEEFFEGRQLLQVSILDTKAELVSTTPFPTTVCCLSKLLVVDPAKHRGCARRAVFVDNLKMSGVEVRCVLLLIQKPISPVCTNIKRSRLTQCIGCCCGQRRGLCVSCWL
jgi:hypothetical protein